MGVAEALLPAYCEVCERLGFPAYSTKEKFAIMTRKDYFKDKCREYGVPTIREFDPANLDSVIYPAIVKPVDSCSSKGIRVAQNRLELEEAINYALQFSGSGKYLIEEYMTGDEVISYYVMQEAQAPAGSEQRAAWAGLRGTLVHRPWSARRPIQRETSGL